MLTSPHCAGCCAERSMLHAGSWASVHIMDTPPSTQQVKQNGRLQPILSASQHQPLERASRAAPDLEWTRDSMARLSFAEVTCCCVCALCNAVPHCFFGLWLSCWHTLLQSVLVLHIWLFDLVDKPMYQCAGSPCAQDLVQHICSYSLIAVAALGYVSDGCRTMCPPSSIFLLPQSECHWLA